MSLLKYDLNNLMGSTLFNTIINSLHDGVLIADGNGYVIYVNSAYMRLTGVSEADVLNRKIQEVRRGARLPEVLKTGKPLLGIRRKVNKVEYIADINPITVDDQVIGAISIVRDITEIAALSSKLKDFSDQVLQLNNKVKEMHRAFYEFENIVGNNNEILNAKNVARRIALGEAPVLILGESGTGKELFAHAIHNASNQCKGPFVAVNCAAFPSHLLSSELFGYEEGAFTGASRGGKPGLFEIAHGGSLFLDEIGDMEFELQSKLLRILETGSFMRIGGTKPIKVNVRVISATNKDIEKLVRETKYREDLFYRLNVMALRIPPLRARTDDIPLLAEYYMEKLCRRTQISYTVSSDALAALSQYHFPGNVRELFNLLEFSASICEKQVIKPADLPIFLKYPSVSHGILADSRRFSEKEVITAALEKFGLSVEGKRKAAEHLGVSLATLYNKIREHRI